MAKIYTSVLLLPFLLLFQVVASDPGDITSYNVHPASVEIQCTNAEIRITAYADDIFRFDVKPHSITFDPLPVPVLTDSLSGFIFQISDTPDSLIVGTSAYIIEFQNRYSFR